MALPGETSRGASINAAAGEGSEPRSSGGRAPVRVKPGPFASPFSLRVEASHGEAIPGHQPRVESGTEQCTPGSGGSARHAGRPIRPSVRSKMHTVTIFGHFSELSTWSLAELSNTVAAAIPNAPPAPRASARGARFLDLRNQRLEHSRAKDSHAVDPRSRSCSASRSATCSETVGLNSSKPLRSGFMFIGRVHGLRRADVGVPQ
jgi:hypothetical protein